MPVATHGHFANYVKMWLCMVAEVRDIYKKIDVEKRKHQYVILHCNALNL
jgi:hypothetical protein